jgi:phosphoribosylamine-glycine ligase
LKIQVIENKGKESTITWTLNRINGDIETYSENSNSSVSHVIADRKAKSTRYGNCQKFKNNVL